MPVKVSDKSIARWIQATAITFVLYLMMGISQSQSASVVLSAWRSAPTAPSRPAEAAPVLIEIPALPR